MLLRFLGEFRLINKKFKGNFYIFLEYKEITFKFFLGKFKLINFIKNLEDEISLFYL